MRTHNPPTNQFEQLRGIIKNLIQDNDEFVRTHEPEYFDPFELQQHPRATAVTCSDARVHSQALDKTPDGDLFIVRILATKLPRLKAQLSMACGICIRLLIIVGHVACRAIKAAAGNYSSESDTIKHELNGIILPC